MVSTQPLASSTDWVLLARDIIDKACSSTVPQVHIWSAYYDGTKFSELMLALLKSKLIASKFTIFDYSSSMTERILWLLEFYEFLSLVNEQQYVFRPSAVPKTFVSGQSGI